MHKLDVIVVTYNRTDLLEKTFHSICAQTYNDCVIKLFNNGGTAINANFIKPFQKQYPDKKIEYHSVPKNTQGVQGIKNICSLMQAEYAVLFHDDDLIHPYYLENAMTAADKNPGTVLITSLALASLNPDDLPYDPRIVRGQPKYCRGDEKTLAAMYFLGVNLCFPSTIYKTEIYKQHIFDWEPYKKLGDRPSTIYYASFGKKGQTLIFLENYIYYRVHAQQDLNNKATALSEQELRNYFLLYKNVLTSVEKIYKNIYTYFSKNFVLLIVSSFGYKMRDFRQSYTHKGVLKKFFFQKNKIKTLKEFENKFLPDMTLDDIFALNFSNYSKQISISNKGKNFITTENISGNGQLKIDVNGFNNNITVKHCTIENGICTILVRGDNHRVEISDEWIGKNLSVFINPSATSVSHLPCHIQINGGTIEDLSIVNPHGGTGVTIKKNHMISMGVSIQNTDSHPIYDAHTKRLLNKPSKDIIINENCWLGMNTTLLKEVVLPQGTIVGFGAVVTHSIEEEQCIVAGVPAKIVKHNVLWKQKDENFF